VSLATGAEDGAAGFDYCVAVPHANAQGALDHQERLVVDFVDVFSWTGMARGHVSMDHRQRSSGSVGADLHEH